MNYILGTGITGLILKVLDDNNKYRLIGNDIGGQFNNSFNMGPRILKYCKESENFLQYLSLEKQKKEYNIGYYFNNKLIKNFTKEMRIKYFYKTRGKNKKFENSSMNDGSLKFDGYDINIDDINFIYIKIKDNVIIDLITKIDLQKKIIFTKNNFYKFNKLINTLPINIFYKLCGIDKKIEYDSVNFYKINKKELIKFNDYEKFNDYDFIYIIDDFICFHRITKLYENNFCIEVKQKRENEFNLIYEDKIILKDAIMKDNSNIDFDYFKKYNIEFCGRYAQATHNMRMHNVIKIAKEII